MKFGSGGRESAFSLISSGYFDAAAKSRLVQQARDLRIIRHHADCYLPLDRRAAVSPMSATYAIMFYLGSLVLYQPEYVERLVRSRHFWLVDAFVRRTPTAFVRHCAEELNHFDLY